MESYNTREQKEVNHTAARNGIGVCTPPTQRSKTLQQHPNCSVIHPLWCRDQ